MTTFLTIIGAIAIVLIILFFNFILFAYFFYRKGRKFPYKRIDIGKFITLYFFQNGRWELGCIFDINGKPLLSFDLIFISLEIEFKEKDYDSTEDSYYDDL